MFSPVALKQCLLREGRDFRRVCKVLALTRHAAPAGMNMVLCLFLLEALLWQDSYINGIRYRTIFPCPCPHCLNMGWGLPQYVNRKEISTVQGRAGQHFMLRSMQAGLLCVVEEWAILYPCIYVGTRCWWEGGLMSERKGGELPYVKPELWALQSTNL